MERSHDQVPGFLVPEEMGDRRVSRRHQEGAPNDRLCDVFDQMYILGWVAEETKPRLVNLTDAEWLAERLKQATLMLQECVEIDPQIRGGVPVLRGTRIPVARILADIADGYSPQEVTDDLDLDLDLVKKLLDGLASSIDRPFA